METGTSEIVRLSSDLRGASGSAPAWGLGRTLWPGTLSALRVAGDYGQLAKPRVATLVLAATAAGFYLGAAGPVHLIALVHAVVGVALVAAGASALNQVLERDIDARMQRTADRPLPAGRLEPGDALRFGVATAVVGMIYLAVWCNPLTSLLAGLTLAGYVFVYTPLKTRTPLSTLVGAVPGALPPLIGWAAAADGLPAAAWAVFGILFLWQLPHFLAIAWIYRDDYAAAGIPLLTAIDECGAAAGRQSLLYSLALVPVSLAPTMLGLAGGGYFLVALALSLVFVGFSLRMALVRSVASARGLFRYSVVYLPLLLAAMMIDKVSAY